MMKDNEQFIREVVRSASAETYDVLRKSMDILDKQIPDGPELWLKQDVLAGVANGEIEGLVTHHPKDMITLAYSLSLQKGPLKLAAMICPDWKGQYDNNGIWIYKMNEVGDSLSQTANTTIRYLERFKLTADKYGVPVSFAAHIPMWEFTRAGDQNSQINGGITITEARSLLDGTIQKTKDAIESLGVETSIKPQNRDDFHDEAFELSTEWRRKREHAVNSVHKVRSEFHGSSFSISDAALEIAESELAWNILINDEKPDILIVPTSPTLARACLSGGNQAWIQLKHGYKG